MFKKIILADSSLKKCHFWRKMFLKNVPEKVKIFFCRLELIFIGFSLKKAILAEFMLKKKIHADSSLLAMN